MINPLRLANRYRDFWHSYDSMAAEKLDHLFQSGCYQPRYYHAPHNNQELILGPGGYLKYSLVITPGAWILGYWHRSQTILVSDPPTFQVQITDVALNHAWFTKPIPEQFFDTKVFISLYDADLPQGPNLLCAPYPVVAPGVFQIEFYQPNAATNRCQLTFAVAEPIPLEDPPPWELIPGGES